LPVFALKTNLFYGAYTYTPNLGFELGLGGHSTLDVGAGYNPWNLDGTSGYTLWKFDSPNADNANRKAVHLLGNIEYRYWLCERFNGHFFGIHGLGSMYNIGGYELPLLFGKGSKDYRYDGWAVGAGISYGYQFILGKHWNLEANIGGGYARLEYDKYQCPKCGEKIGKESRDYFGPTKAGISLIYIFF
jgi:putative salt-induced outer membrane protein YdiY